MADDAFLQAILDNPQDDSPRLIYADWLEEQGDPVSQAKAEFLRLTAELSAPGRWKDRARALRERIPQVVAGLDTNWWATVGRFSVGKCVESRPGADSFGCERTRLQLVKGLGLTPEMIAVRRIRFLPQADRSVIASIGCGILFFMAFWSGPSVQAFAFLKRVLAQVDPEGCLELVIVDVDGCQDLVQVPEFRGNFGGVGETAWLQRGRVLLWSGMGFRPECFEPNTRALLAECLSECASEGAAR